MTSNDKDAYWYRVRYLLASDDAHAQLEAWQGKKVEEANATGVRAREMSKELAADIEDRLCEPAANREQRNLHKFLQDIEPSALLLWAGVVTLLEGGVPTVATSSMPFENDVRQRLKQEIHKTNPSAIHVVRLVEDRLKLSARSRYNLACYYGVVAMLAHAAEDRKAERQYSLSAVVQLDLAAPGFSTAMAQWARRDPCFHQLARDHYKKDFEQALAREAGPSGS